MCVTDRQDMTFAVKVALNPVTANKPNFPRAKKKRNKECTIITITLVLKKDLQGIDPAASHSQVGQPKHSAKKAVKALEIAILWSELYSIQRNESQQAAYLLENTSTLVCPSLRRIWGCLTITSPLIHGG